MAWFWARVKARTPRLGTFEGGFQAFVDVLADDVQARAARSGCGRRIDRIEPRNPGRLAGRLRPHFREAYRPLPGDDLADAAGQRLTPSLPADYLAGLRSLQSMGAVVLVLALRHRLSEAGVYWHNLPKAAGFPSWRWSNTRTS